jgi:hypothetical protein
MAQSSIQRFENVEAGSPARKNRHIVVPLIYTVCTFRGAAGQNLAILVVKAPVHKGGICFLGALK